MLHALRKARPTAHRDLARFCHLFRGQPLHLCFLKFLLLLVVIDTNCLELGVSRTLAELGVRTRREQEGVS